MGVFVTEEWNKDIMPGIILGNLSWIYDGNDVKDRKEWWKKFFMFRNVGQPVVYVCWWPDTTLMFCGCLFLNIMLENKQT